MTLQHSHLHRKRDVWDDIKDVFTGGSKATDDESESPSKGDNENGNGNGNGNGNSSNKAPAPAPAPAVDTGSGSSSGSESNSGLQANDPKGGAITVVRTKFETLAPTFEGEVAGFTTLLPGQEGDSGDGSVPPEITQVGPEDDFKNGLAFAPDTTSIPRAAPTPNAPTVPTQLPAAETSSASSDASKNGTSNSAKAGIAIGILAAVLIAFGLVYFIVAKRKKSRRQSIEDDEKLNGPFGQTDAELRAQPNAPRVSLRPVTQFLPNLNMMGKGNNGHHGNHGYHGDQFGSAPAAAAGAVMSNRPRGGSAWERPMTSQSANPANPFGHQAERIYTPVPEEHLPHHRPVSPMDADHTISHGRPVSPLENQTPAFNSNPHDLVDQLATNGPAAGGLVRGNSLKGGPKLDLTLPPPAPLPTVPPSPSGTEFSMTSTSPVQNYNPSASAAAIAAAGGPQGSTVHRVQLDFKPTLEDEMELRAGQLIRLLHEYDDGWALCIRLDRSQQGVVPRTCLSTRPVKPRPQNGQPRGPPVNPSGRAMSPPQGSGQSYNRPESPNRPMAGPGGRPISPHQSPGPRYQPMPVQGRPKSPHGMGRRASPPGPPMNPAGGPYRQGPQNGTVGRKPVPGAAY